MTHRPNRGYPSSSTPMQRLPQVPKGPAAGGGGILPTGKQYGREDGPELHVPRVNEPLPAWITGDQPGSPAIPAGTVYGRRPNDDDPWKRVCAIWGLVIVCVLLGLATLAIFGILGALGVFK